MRHAVSPSSRSLSDLPRRPVEGGSAAEIRRGWRKDGGTRRRGLCLGEGGTLIARYRSYLVRVWTSDGCDGPQWAGRVECMQDDTKQRRFHDPDAMLGYLSLAVRRDAGRSDEHGADDRQTGGPHA